MADTDDRSRLLARIETLHRELGRIWARYRSSPLLASTLTMQQLKVVMLLNQQESASGQELAHHLGVGLATITGIVDRLVTRGLVTRHEDPSDRRIRRVQLTEAGRKVANDLVDAGSAEFRRVTKLLDLEALRALELVLRRVLEIAETEQCHLRDFPPGEDTETDLPGTRDAPA